MDNYKDFTAEDFAADEKFQDWVLKPDPANDAYWNHWLENHPDQQKEVDRARQLILKIREEIKPEPLRKDDFHRIWERISEKNEIVHHRSNVYNLVTRAAVAVVGLMVLIYGVAKYSQLEYKEDFVKESYKGITLELQDGTVVPLDEHSSGIISLSGDKPLARQNQNELVYEKNSELFQEEGEELIFNVLTVPYGKRFELTLSDGTHVYLNAGSSLRYPIRFPQDGSRDVYLDGEGYFIVSADVNRLFTVHTSYMDTQVHGTKFNVSSYRNDRNTFTVLVEGSVSILKDDDMNSLIMELEPGQRAVYEGGEIEIEETDVDKYTAWVEGKLLFTNDRFELILKKLERHFDVEFENQFFELNSRQFTGTFHNESLDQILAVFIAHTSFEYEQQQNKIIIKRPR